MARHTVPLLSLILLLVGCPLAVSEREEGTVTLTMTASSGARTILPEMDVRTYRISFDGPSSVDSVTTGNASTTIVLPEGSWSISADGLDADGDKIASGSERDVQISEGKDTDVSLILLPLTKGSGIIDVAVSWPASVSIDSYEVTLDGSAVPGTALSSPDALSVRYRETKAAGAYVLVLALKRGGALQATVTEAVQVYANLSSAAEIALTAADFTGAPAVPGSLAAAALSGGGGLRITWTDESHVESGFRLERSPDNAAWTSIGGDLAANAVSYEDRTASEGQTYYYRARAFNAFGVSAYSNIAAGRWSSSSSSSIVIDHRSVELYDDIPDAYIALVKRMWFNLPGESHSSGYRNGVAFLEAQNSRYAVSVLESGTPEAYTTDNLRVSRASWGDYDHSTGWRYGYGEEDWFTSAAARTGTKRHIEYSHDNGFGLSAIGFGWCWDMTWHNGVGGTADPVYGCRWAGSSVGGPDGDLRWGLDSGDEALTGNGVSLDTYLEATQEYIDFCEDNGIPTTVFFTTGPVDGYEGESGYQRHLKHERIRAYVESSGGVLFDYADILAWDDSGSERTETWSGHAYQMIADDNMLDLDGSYAEDGDHIGERGALRLGKAVWVLLARLAGWNP